MATKEEYHIPVLCKESINGLNIRPEGIYVDLTFGGGGHSKAILERLQKGKLFAFDKDDAAARNTINDERFVLIREDFRYFKNMLKYLGIKEVDGIIADLGVSWHHYDTKERGFSFRFNSLLDMRMDTEGSLTASDILRNYKPEELRRIFQEFGEVKNVNQLVNCIVNGRGDRAITTVEDLKNIIQVCIPKFKEHKYLAKVFQALRIEVNGEMKALKEMLEKSESIMKENGRLVVISYHSLEDKIVKNYINKGNFNNIIHKDFYGNVLKPFKAISRKVIVPNDEEIRKNNRARSAKLRIAERIKEDA